MTVSGFAALERFRVLGREVGPKPVVGPETSVVCCMSRFAFSRSSILEIWATRCRFWFLPFVETGLQVRQLVYNGV